MPYNDKRPFYGYDFRSYPGTPEIKTAPLPKCHQCQEKDVKPGEDQCWECLGEEQEKDWADPYQTIYIGQSPSPAGIVITNGSLTVNKMDIEKAILSIEQRLQSMERKLTVWQRIKWFFQRA